MLAKRQKMLLAVAMLTSAGAVQAGLPVTIYGQQSDPDDVFEVKPAWNVLFDSAGVKVNTRTGTQSFYVMAIPGEFRREGSNSLGSVPVFHFSSRQAALSNFAPSVIATRGTSGIWTFARAGLNDVWFGEWNAEAPTGPTGTKVAGTHNVFYIGTKGYLNGSVINDAGSNTVSYTIKSINNYVDNGTLLPTSQLSANFATQVASSVGDVAFSNGTIAYAPNFTRVTLAANNVSVASANGTGGTLTGDFFGASQGGVMQNAGVGPAAVAGIVTFTDRYKNTAFGGLRN